MTSHTCTWRGIKFEVEYGEAPGHRFLYHFKITSVMPAGVHLPLWPPPRDGYHYVGYTELAEHQSFRAYLLSRLERDASPAVLTRNDRLVKASRQLQFDF